MMTAIKILAFICTPILAYGAMQIDASTAMGQAVLAFLLLHVLGGALIVITPDDRS